MSTPLRFAIHFAILLAFWLALSNQYGLLFLGMGVVSALVVTAATQPLIAACFEQRQTGLHPFLRAWRALVYLAWLVWRMIVAGAQIAYFVLHPRMPLRPGLLRFRTRLRSPLARVVVANSITLVPGTLTLVLDDDEYLVHALVPAAVEELLDGRMQRMVGRVFLEEPDDPLSAAWEDAMEVAP